MLPIDPPLTQAKLRASFGGPYVANDLADHIADLVDQMSEEQDKGKRQNLARMVLAYDRENIDAYLVLADAAASTGEALALLREAVRIGKHVWAETLYGKDIIQWWDMTGTRPFMRAIMAYGNALVGASQPDQAALCFETLIKMQPNDSLGAREALRLLTPRNSGGVSI
jgi:hypothetical protein